MRGPLNTDDLWCCGTIKMVLYKDGPPCSPAVQRCTLNWRICDVSHYCRYVHSKNRAGLSFSVALNSLSDRTMPELAVLMGRTVRKNPNRGLPFPAELYKNVRVPESIDWRLYGMCTQLIMCRRGSSPWQDIQGLSSTLFLQVLWPPWRTRPSVAPAGALPPLEQ